ncbi:YggS family pyridoxal phosphate-dependent enzyme [Comamonadaceae bacterium M7527]|nr:YggS family pyridoxal phosphate-dependent enzyme [Comamonadaceae bacterium M7527]
MSEQSSRLQDTSARRLQSVREQINAASSRYNRPVDAVTLLAVSKTWPAQAVADMARAGQLAFGENYIQEGVDKVLAVRELLPHAALQWHCIGPIQSNKTKLVAAHFDWVHSIDRLKIAQRLSEQRPAHLPPLQVCVQVNVDDAPSKAGVAVQHAQALALDIAALPNLVLRGIMCIPDPVLGFEAQVDAFQRATHRFREWQQAGLAVDTLSMGMSGDLDAAIAAGSTMVRVGTALFGVRDGYGA